MFTDVSEECIASIFIVEEKGKKIPIKRKQKAEVVLSSVNRGFGKYVRSQHQSPHVTAPFVPRDAGWQRGAHGNPHVSVE
jgi:hypothetical protein